MNILNKDYNFLKFENVFEILISFSNKFNLFLSKFGKIAFRKGEKQNY